MAGIEKVVTVSYIKELVEKQAKTHKEVSELLRQRYPAVEGLSERSARRHVLRIADQYNIGIRATAHLPLP